MSEQENVILAKQVYAAFNAGNISALLDMHAEDATWTYPEVENAAYTGPRKGRSQIGEFFHAMGGAEHVLGFTQDDFIAQGNNVVVRGRYDARVGATDRTFSTDYVHILTIGNGKIQTFAAYFDTAVVADAHRQSTGAGA